MGAPLAARGDDVLVLERCATPLVRPALPTPETLDYEAILDAPYDPRTEARGSRQAQREFRESLRYWRYPLEGVGSLQHSIDLLRLAPHWLRRARGYVTARSDWGFEERRDALLKFTAVLMDRLRRAGAIVPWRIETYVSKQGHLVLTGDRHRLVLLNQPGAPVVQGPIAMRERQWIARVGGCENYYRAWFVTNPGDFGLAPVVDEPYWDALRRQTRPFVRTRRWAPRPFSFRP